MNKHWNRFLKLVEKPKQDVRKQSMSVHSSAFMISEIPCIAEKKNKEYVFFGEDNLYPLFIENLLLGSAIHNAIVIGKSKMTAGDGFLINGAKTKEESDAKYLALDSATKTAYDLFLNNPYGNQKIKEINNQIALDIQTYGAFALEIVWNVDFTQISNIRYVKVKNVRSGKLDENDEVECYYVSRDWSKLTQNPAKEIYSFDPDDKEHMNQLLYVKTGNLDYYGIPSYIAAINWIRTEEEMAIFHRSNIENGMSPGMHFNFFKKPATQDEEDMVVAGIKKTWQGARKTGKMVATFNEGKDLAMEIKPIETSNLDKQLLLLAELCDKKILTGHGVTSPLLFGISISGQLGGNTELTTAYQIFDKEVIAYDRNILNETWNELLKYSGVNITVEINPFNPIAGLENTSVATPATITVNGNS